MFHSHVPFLGACFPCCICIDFLGQTDSVNGESVTICSVSFDRSCARAMPHKVTELDGLAGTLLARHTVGRLSLSRNEQVGLLRNAIQCFLSYQLHRLQADGTWKQKLGVALLAQCSSRAGDSQHVGEEPRKRRIPALGEHITKVRGRVVATKGIMRMRTCACVSVCNSFWCLYIYTCSPLIYFRYLYVCVFLSLQRTTCLSWGFLTDGRWGGFLVGKVFSKFFHRVASGKVSIFVLPCFLTHVAISGILS